jgi:hypothetical protein
MAAKKMAISMQVFILVSLSGAELSHIKCSSRGCGWIST